MILQQLVLLSIGWERREEGRREKREKEEYLWVRHGARGHVKETGEFWPCTRGGHRTPVSCTFQSSLLPLENSSHHLLRTSGLVNVYWQVDGPEGGT